MFDIYGYDIGTDNSLITLNMQIVYENLKAGGPYIISTAFNEIAANDLPNGWSFQYTVLLDGIAIFTDTIVADSNQNDKINKIGRTIPNNSANITLSVVFARNPSQDMHFHINLALLEVSNVWDPNNLCCNTKCPANTALNLQTNPFRCL